MISTKTLLPIRYAETDKMGVVHHSHYPVYFEAARTDFFAQHLIHYQEMERAGLFAPILRLEMDIEGPLTYGDTLVVETFPAWLKGLKISMTYVLSLDNGSRVGQGLTIHALCGRDLRPIHPRNFKDIYALLGKVFPRP